MTLTMGQKDLVQAIVGSPGRLPDADLERIYRRFQEHFAPTDRSLSARLRAFHRGELSFNEARALVTELEERILSAQERR